MEHENESSNANGVMGVERKKRQIMQYQCIIILEKILVKNTFTCL